MPLVATRGAASAQGFGEFAQSATPTYIEDVFSTYLYTGNGSTQTITNGIDLSGKGGLTWIKFRNPAADGITGEHCLFDTARGATYRLRTNATNPQGAVSTSLTSFNSDGFTLGAFDQVNSGYLSRQTYVSWTFRKKPKFFDVVTFTQSGTSGWQTVNHNLGSVPGCIIFKNASTTSNWNVYHRYNATKKLILNSTSAEINETIVQNLTSTSFEVSITNIGNNNGDTFVAYLFAHDAGGFGTAGTDNVISCGSFTTDGTGSGSVTLGYEPQFVLLKATSEAGDWYIEDNMRGWQVSGNNKFLLPNTSGAEANYGDTGAPNATGFTVKGLTAAAGTMIYIAIRRGPMKTPTSGTSVFKPDFAYNTNNTISGYLGAPADANFYGVRAGNANNFFVRDRLRGGTIWLATSNAGAENTAGAGTAAWDNMLGYYQTTAQSADSTIIEYTFRRAPGFFDEVCYSGDGVTTGRQLNHNLNVAPELMIVKYRNTTSNWCVYNKDLTSASYALYLNATTAQFSSFNLFYGTSPSSTTFTVGEDLNFSGYTFVAYLFATCPGVSKVGSYTGTGTTKQIDCGFTGGARFVLIKRTDSTGDWYVWDSARGIVAGNDPYLLLNSTAAEVTSTDYVDTYSAGFEISSTAPAAINANGGTFIFLAIA